jgi:hypothetical protein
MGVSLLVVNQYNNHNINEHANLNYEIPAPPYWPESRRDSIRALDFPSRFS